LNPLVRTEVIVGENTAELLLESEVALFNPALKVRNVIGEILNVTTHILPDTVLVQGQVKHHLFYVGTDMVVHHQTKEVPFCTYAQIPGTEPSMKASVHHCIESILSDLGADGTLVKLKAVLGLLVKVTEERELKLEEGEGPSYLLPGICGESMVEEVYESTITLNKSALKVTEVNAQVIISEAQVIADKVVVKGHISEDVFAVGAEDNIEHHQKEDIPFSSLVELPGVCRGMQAEVRAEVDEIRYELAESGSELKQKIVYALLVKVSQDIEMGLAVGGTLIKAKRVVGTETLCKLLQYSLDLVPAAQKVNQVTGEVTDLNADVIAGKVIIQGIFDARIYFTDHDGINYETEERLPFVGHVAVDGAEPGMKAKVTPTVSGIITEFNAADNLLHIKVLLKMRVKALQWVQAAVAECAIA
jgi:hypothetical protein